MNNYLTLIQSKKPSTVAKSYSTAADGTLVKKAIAHITDGIGRTIDVPDANAMTALLQQVTTSQNLVLCSGTMRGAGDTPYRIVTEAALAEVLQKPVGDDALGGVHIHKGEAIAARLKRGMDPSSWLLLETDNPPGMPDDWKQLSLAERLRKLEAVLPGISSSERIELRGSSARVHDAGACPGGHTHAWVRVSDPEQVPILRQHVHVHATLKGVSFKSPRYSRTGPHKVVGHSQRTLLDLAVWDHGRLVFVAQPDVRAQGYQAADADIRIVNAGAGPLDISGVTLPDDDALRDFAKATGAKLEYRRGKSGLYIRSTGELTWETDIDRRGETKSLRQWVATMKSGEKLRCETPFRDSNSEAAVLRLGKGRWPVLHDVGSGITYFLAKDAADPPGPPSSDSGAADLPNDIELTEDGIALAFEREHQSALRYCHDTGAWFVWAGTHWQQNRDGLAFTWARQLVRKLNREAELKLKAITGKASFAGAVEKYAQRARTIAVTAATWDQDPFLIGTPAGVVDLQTGELRPALREDYITKQTAVAPSPDLQCPIWLSFLHQATAEDSDLIRFLQQWCGYSLTGSTREHALLFVYGPGGNGKSVLLNTVARILGDYHQTAAMNTFTEAGASQHLTFLAMMRGARMVAASETEEGRPWAESRIKQMTGGDPITANFMRRDPFTFLPQFKLLIVGNHKPALRNVDDAARRRFNIVPFVHKPTAPDRQLEEKLWREAPGILRWMIEGCLDWQRNGLMRPAVVVEATAEYFQAQDTIGRWLAECCIRDASLAEKPGKLLSNCRAWATENGELPPTSSSFRSAIEKVDGVRYATVRGIQFVKGVGLKPSLGDPGR